MAAITGFLTQIVSFFGAAVKILGSFLAGLAQLIYVIPQALTMLTYTIASMPSVLVIFATAFISVSVVYLVVGR